MSKVESWGPVQKSNINKHAGNNIDKRNITAIETYNAIEGNADRDRKYPGFKELFEMHRGERL